MGRIRLFASAAPVPAVLLAPLLATPFERAQSDDLRLGERAAELAERFAAPEGVPGLSIALDVGGRTLLARGFGYADLEHMSPAEADTVYRIGSLTQPFTAVAILQLLDDGKLSLDEPLGNCFPDWPEAVRGITIEELLTHTSGLVSYTGLGLRFGDDFCAGMTREDVLALFLDQPLEFEPGTQFAFSSSGYFVLGLVVEKVSGQSYPDYLTRHVFEPLGMEHTVYCYEDSLLVRRASGYQEIAGELENDAPLSIEHPFSAGALCSTAPDLVRFQRGLVDGTLLRPSTFARMAQPTVLPDGTHVPFGLGLSLDETDGHPAIGCGGAINGFRSHLAYYPELDLSIALLANAEDAPLHELEHAIARVALGLAPEELRDLALEPDAQRPYLGAFQVGSSRYLVQSRGPRLLVVPPLDPEYELLYQGDDRFVSAADPSTRFVFQVVDGRAESFRLLQGGFEQLARRVE